MSEVVILIVFALIFAILGFLTRNAGKRTQKLQTAKAKIDRLSHSDGDIIYYVSFYNHGKLEQGKSIVYPGSGERLQVGAVVDVEYYFTKAGWPRVIIQDPNLIPRERTAGGLPKVLNVLSAGFFIAAVLFLLKNLLFLG